RTATVNPATELRSAVPNTLTHRVLYDAGPVQLETRAAVGASELQYVTGYAVRYGVLSEILPAGAARDAIGPFRERFSPGAFTKSLATSPDIRALVGHDPNAIIGRTPRTLKVREDKNGVYVELQPANTSNGRDMVESIRRGDVQGFSFGFDTDKATWSADSG